MISVQRIHVDFAEAVTTMVGELLSEIMREINSPAFDFDHSSTIGRLEDFLERGIYDGAVAFSDDQAIGFATVYESHSLYGCGAYGTIPELYVRPEYRSRGVGAKLVSELRKLAGERGWTMLEVTTPPLPEFDRTLEFYQRAGFVITGGRKLKIKV